ncbi:MAG: YeeE/YedE thiosulfate transporter family protein [Bacteroidota bacterium]
MPTILILGFLFGAILQYAHLNKFNVIMGLSVREDYTVPKAIALAVGIGAILLNTEIALGFASYHVKPLIITGIVLGGLIFGTGMAILGYCPGTMVISLGEGSLDALIGILGGLTGGVVYTLSLPWIQPLLGPDLGALSMQSVLANKVLFFILLVVVAAVFIYIAFWLHRIDKNKERKWIVAGIFLAFLDAAVFSTWLSNRPIGASTSFPFVGDFLTGVTQNDYFTAIKTPGHWELIFLAGAFAAGLVISIIKKEFRLVLMHENWLRFKGSSPIRRIFWAFVGGFILIFGARMAGGCTSGHILSGGMQLAFSSLIFAIFVFIGLLVTGQVFYKPGKGSKSDI